MSILPPLEQALYKSVEVGQQIPPHLYRAVGEILGRVMKSPIHLGGGEDGFRSSSRRGTRPSSDARQQVRCRLSWFRLGRCRNLVQPEPSIPWWWSWRR